MYPTTWVSSEDGDQTDNSKIPGRLPEHINLDLPSKDLLLRLLQKDPVQRLRSLRTLQSIAFYKGYNFEDVRNKKIRPKDILSQYFPDGPPIRDELDSENFANFDTIV